MRKLSSHLLPAVFLGALAMTLPASSDDHVQHDVISPRLEIAGLDDDAAWGRAALIEQLVLLGSQLSPVEQQAEARVMHDERALFIEVRLASGEAGDIPRLALNDRRVYSHERVELFLDESPGEESYYQIVVDRGGNIRATRTGMEEEDRREGTLAEDVEVAVAEVEGGWLMRIAIPFAAIGAETPAPGDLYRLKVCRDGSLEGPMSWPPNPTSGFHVREADGALYFETMDLLINGDFEEGEGEHLPPPWSASLTSPEVDNAPQGTVETLAGVGVDGGRAVRKTKLLDALWWPQIWSPGYDLEPGAHYEFSIMARGSLPTVNLRASGYADGQRVMRLSQSFEVPEEWERLRYYFSVPHEAPRISVGLSAPNMISGEVFYDKAMLRRVLMAADGSGLPPVATYDPDPDQLQGLYAFAERQGHKPWDLYIRDEGLLTRRTIFRDRQFGTWVWMMDDSHTVGHVGTASVWPAWNANASLLYLPGARIGPDGRQSGWLATADGTRLIKVPGEGGSMSFDRQNPDLLFLHRSGSLVEANVRTGETRTVAQWEPYPRERIYGFTRDNRYLFLDTPNGGLWVTYEPDPNDPIPQWGLHDGRPEAPDPDGNARNPREADNILNLSRNVVAETAEWGHIFLLRVGLLIDRQTGEMEKVIAPMSGHEGYLRAFISDRVNFPSGGGWEDYRVHASEDIDEMFEIYRYYPTATHGHESPSPDGEFIAKDGGPTIFPTRGGTPINMRLSPNGGNYHLHWVKHPRYFIGWVRGWSFGSYVRPANANIEFQVFTDRTFQPIVDTKHLFNGYYGGGDFSMQSPDSTKIHYGSSMTGRFKNYVAVMARPRPPQNLTWQADGGAVALNWQPSAYSRETRGYLVYRSDRSGDEYALLTQDPVEATTWRDETAEAGQAYHYVVTSIEHSGLESGYSAEIARAGIDLPAQIEEPLVVYAEPEHSIRDLYTTDRPGLAMGVDRLDASDWYYLYRHPDDERGEATLAVSIPAAGDYHLWARLRSGQVARSVWQISAGDTTAEVATGETQWTWVRAGDGPVSLPAGSGEVALSTSDRHAQLDLICLVTDANFTPEGPRPEKTTPPAPVTALRAENVRERVNHLTWEPSDDPTLSHYQVYASREPIAEASQELLVGSPVEAEMFDWGLQAGTTYHYAVTTVDRRGNESAIATARAATPAEDPAVTIALTFDEAEREGPFEQSEAGDTHGAFYVVPEEPQTNAVSWQIEVPRADDYYLWLRYLHRGNGGRGGEVSQNVRVLVDDEQVTTLGGGLTDLHVPDAMIAESHPLHDRLWTWAWPGGEDLVRVPLEAGPHTLRLQDFAPGVRYDALVLTSEPTWVPEDGRLRQR